MDKIKQLHINPELEGVAVIGMACRFPGADNIEVFWKNLIEGKSSITEYTENELINAGVEKALLDNPNYIKAGSHIRNIDLFDASFFGYTPREAEIMDPQHRIYMECAWETFEDAGYIPESYKGLIGVFGGCGSGHYLSKNIVFNPQLIENIGDFQVIIGNNNDYFTTRISYKFNLHGPSINIQTACSTSLVSICTGYQNLITYQCDMALCGGASLQIPHRQGYLYKEGFISSPTGVLSAFDEKANGTVQGEGAGAVLLKRLDEAVRDGDHIYAVIRGAAINNDGSLKAGFTAPSIDGQANAIALAQEIAEIDPDTITYVETHGTGTPLGDPIEIAGLTKAFRARTDRKNYCALGAVKTNIGHLDAAAGVAGLIKAALSIKNRQLTPTLNFSKANSKLNIEETPFFVNTALSDWNPEDTPLRAGVSAFGIGGTNSHVILEEAPLSEESSREDRYEVLLLSAKTETSLDEMKKNLAAFMENNSGINLSDAAYTLQTGRKLFSKRFAVVCRTPEDAHKAISSGEPRFTFFADESRLNQPAVFMFTGQGSQYAGMTGGLYSENPVFRKEVDRCSEILKKHLGRDLRKILYPDDESRVSAETELARTEIAQPALFTIEYALAHLWMRRGIKPAAFIGHSLGEYVAACLAGVFSLEDALQLISARGRLIQSMPRGTMLSVVCSPDELSKYLTPGISIGVINGPELCVASGDVDSIKSLEHLLREHGIVCSRLNTSHAFHSSMMEAACTPFMNELNKIKFSPPSVPYISNVTGTWITADDAVTPSYWVKHMRETVNFSGGIKTLLDEGFSLFLENGPENTLCSIAQRIIRKEKGTVQVYLIPSLSHPKSNIPDSETIARAFAKLLASGASINFDETYKDEKRLRISLPTYVFDRQRYWLEPASCFTEQSISCRNIEIMDTVKSDSLAIQDPVNSTEDGMEYIMSEIWREILGFKDIKNTDNFFELGGDSLKATQLIALINKRLGLSLTLADLFIDPTVKSLAQFAVSSIDNKQRTVIPERQFPVLFPIQPKGVRRPMFIVAGAHENRYYDPVQMKSSYEEDFLRYLSQLIPHIGLNQPLYGFRPKGLIANEKPHNSVQEMAAAYINKLRKFQPEGPYLISGECVGGVVAYEIAQQLSSAGLEVAHLILMDTYCHSKLSEFRERYILIRRKTAKIIRKRLKYLRNIEIKKLLRALRLDIQFIQILLLPMTENLRTQRQIMLRSYKYQVTLMKYRPAPYPGEITMLVNQEWYSKYPQMGWNAGLKNKMSIIPVPGDHKTRLTTYGEITGKHLHEIIDKTWKKYNL